MELTKSFLTFKPIENQKLWNSYQEGLQSALARFGVEKIVLSNFTIKDSDTYAILSLDTEGRILGGIRLEVKLENKRLPLEKVSFELSDILSQKINKKIGRKEKLGEICGLWVSKDAKGRGLGSDLAFEATKLGTKLKVDSLISMLPAHTLNYFLQLGYVADPDLPKLAYPDDRYLSTVVWYHVPEIRQKSSNRDTVLE